VFAYAARTVDQDAGTATGAEEILLGTECRLVARLRQLQRTVAAEEANGLPQGAGLFLSLDSSEIGDALLVNSIKVLRDLLGEDRALVVEIPDSSLSDTPYFHGFRDSMKETGIGIACSGFATDERRVAQCKMLDPRFLKLAEPVVRNIDRSDQQQRQVAAIVASCREIGCDVVAVGVHTEEEAACCRSLGCRFGQGSLFDEPRTALP